MQKSNIYSYNNKVKEQAIALLNAGAVVALPTETVYGLAGDATSAEAINNIYRTKGRPTNNPLIVHVLKSMPIADWVELNDSANILMNEFWPGPLTIVFKLKAGHPFASNLLAGHNSVALRMPNSKIFLDILAELNKPIAAPSANKSEGISPTLPEHVAKSLPNKLPLIIDGGQCQVGLESTIVDCRNNDIRILRYGVITERELANFVSMFNAPSENSVEILAPGQMLKHYSPQKTLVLNITKPEVGDIWLGFGDMPEIEGVINLNLSKTNDLGEIAKNLFKMLWQADSMQGRRIVVMPIDNNGIGAAINDRLFRASQK